MLDAVEEPNTSKSQALPSGSLYWEEREKEILKCLQCKRNTHTHTHTHTKEFSNRKDEYCQRFWVWPSRRRSGNELGLEEWIAVNMQKWGWEVFPDTGNNLGQEGWRWDWHLLKCRVCNLPCLVLHLRPLALHMTGNRHLIHAHWKLNEKQTKFRAWMSDHSMV